MSKSRSVRRKGAILAAISMAVASAGVAKAASLTWNGGGGNDNLSTGANWAGGIGPAASGDDLTFAGATRLTPANDIAGLSVSGIAFASGASSFNLGGANAISLSGGITQASANNQTISAGLVLDGATSNVNVTGGGSLALGSLTLGATAGSTNVNTINVNNTVTAAAMLTRTDSASANVLNIASGATFNLTGSFNIGFAPSGAANTLSNLNFAGAGTFNLTTATNANFNIGIGAGSNTPTGQPRATVDMSGLANFVYSTGTAGTGQFGVGNLVTRPSSTLRLANTSNSITAATFVVGDSNQAGGNNNGNGNTLFLGAGTNVFNANTFNIGFTKTSGVIQWDPAVTTGSIVIAGQTGGASTANMTLGRGSSATSTNATSQLNLAGHQATVQLNTLTLGNLAGSTAGTSAGSVSFDTGTFSVNNLVLGLDASGTAASGARGTFTLGTDASSTGTLNVNTSFLLGNVTNASTGTKVNGGTFTVNGGTANINADIVSAKNGAATGTTQTTAINLSGGTVNMNGKNIGTAALPITAINLTGGALNGANRITATTTTISGGVTLGGTPTFVIPDNGMLNSSLAPLIVNGGIEGGGPLGPGNVSGAVQVASGGRITPGSSSAAATLAFANDLSLTSGSIARFKLSPTVGAGNDLVTVGGNLSVAGTVNIDVGILGTGPAAGNTYTLFTYGGSLTGNETNFSVPNINARTTYSIVPTATTPGQVQLTVGGSPSLALTWTGSTSNNWNLIGTANFQDGVAAPQQFYNLDTVTFDDVSTNVNPVQIVGTLQPGSVTVNAARNYTFAGAGAITGNTGLIKQSTGTLVIANDNTFNGLTHVQGGTLQLGNGGTTGSLAGPIQNDSNLVLSYSDSHTVSSAISGFGVLTKNGANTVTLSGTSTYNGQTVINGGTLQFSTIGNIGVASNLGGGPGGSGDISINNGATLKFIGGANATSNRGFRFSTGGATLDSSPTVGGIGLTLNGADFVGFLEAGPRTLTLAGTDLTPLLIGTNQLGLTISDQDPDAGKTSILKVGNNRWQLNSANSYSGGTTISAGGVRINNAGGFGTGTVSVANGAQAYLNATGDVVNSFSIAGIGPAEAPGTEITGNFGALRVANVGVNLTGNVTLTGDARITGRGAGLGGTIAGQISGNFALEFGNSGGGTGAVIISNPGNSWSGNTTVSHGTLKAGASDVIPHGAGKGNVIVSNTSPTLDSVLDLNGNNLQINGLSSSGADLTRVKVLNNAGGVATITVGDNDASATFGGVIQNGTAGVGVTKIGSGTQVLTGVNTYAGATTVNAGKLQVANNLTTSSSVTVNGGVLELASGGGSNRVLRSPSISTTGTGRIDLRDNKVITDLPVGSATGGVYDGVQRMVQTASNGGAWTGPGLTTSLPAAATGLTSIGVASGAQLKGLSAGQTATFAGQTITDTSTVAMYTYAGDANMDGFISGDDYSAIDFNIATPGSNGWFNGDFNYDGIISGDDYSAIDFNIVAQGTPFPTAADAASAPGLMGVTAVPEPASIVLLAVTGASVLARRRRRG